VSSSQVKTLHDLLEEQLEHLRSLNAGAGTIRNAAAYVRTFLQWLEQTYGTRSPERLRKKHLEAWTRHLSLHRTAKGLPLKTGTMNAYNDKVRGFLRYLVRHGYLPAAYLDLIAYIKTPQLLPRSVLTHAQVRKLLAKIDTATAAGHRDRTMLETLYSTGIRAAELLGLDVAHVDVANATVLVHGKGRKERVVPVGRTALRFLESYIAGVRPFLVARRSFCVHGKRIAPRDDQALFLTSRGTRMSYPRFLQYVHRYGELAGLDVNVTPHTFRRYAEFRIMPSRLPAAA
jgi:site-specific recombinase XerD